MRMPASTPPSASSAWDQHPDGCGDQSEPDRCNPGQHAAGGPDACLELGCEKPKTCHGRNDGHLSGKKID